MNQPLIIDNKPDAKAIAGIFRAMADTIELNGAGAFGGAFVVVPPANGGEPVHTLILDGSQDPAQFWGILKTKSDIALASVEQVVRNQRGFGR